MKISHKKKLIDKYHEETTPCQSEKNFKIRTQLKKQKLKSSNYIFKYDYLQAPLSSLNFLVMAWNPQLNDYSLDSYCKSIFNEKIKITEIDEVLESLFTDSITKIENHITKSSRCNLISFFITLLLAILLVVLDYLFIEDNRILLSVVSLFILTIGFALFYSYNKFRFNKKMNRLVCSRKREIVCKLDDWNTRKFFAMGYEWQPGLRGSWLILKKLKVSLGSKDKMTYMTITNREQSPPNCNSGGHLGVNDNMNCDRTAISKSLNDRTFTSDPIKDENGPN